MGLAHQLMIMTIMFILNQKYPDKLVKYTGFVFTGTAVSYAWGYVFTKVNNPTNEEKTVEYFLPNGDTEHTFSKEVSLRFVYLCLVYGLTNVVVSFGISLFIRVSSQLEEGFSDGNNPENSIKHNENFCLFKYGSSNNYFLAGKHIYNSWLTKSSRKIRI